MRIRRLLSRSVILWIALTGLCLCGLGATAWEPW